MNTNNIISLDFETYYDQDFSLKNMSYQEYCEDPRMDPFLLGSSRKVDDVVRSICIEKDYMQKFLDDVASKKDLVCVMHNAPFDTMVMKSIFGIELENPLCTLQLSHYLGFSDITSCSLGALAIWFDLPHKGQFLSNMMGKTIEDLTLEEATEYREYCRRDTEIDLMLFDKLYSLIENDEKDFVLNTIKNFIRMTRHDFFLDKNDKVFYPDIDPFFYTFDDPHFRRSTLEYFYTDSKLGWKSMRPDFKLVEYCTPRKRPVGSHHMQDKLKALTHRSSDQTLDVGTFVLEDPIKKKIPFYNLRIENGNYVVDNKDLPEFSLENFREYFWNNLVTSNAMYHFVNWCWNNGKEAYLLPERKLLVDPEVDPKEFERNGVVFRECKI